MKRKIHKFAVIFSHAEQPDDGYLCYVDATSPGSAVEQVSDEVTCGDSVWEGYDFTIWPVPVN